MAIHLYDLVRTLQTGKAWRILHRRVRFMCVRVQSNLQLIDSHIFVKEISSSHIAEEYMVFWLHCGALWAKWNDGKWPGGSTELDYCCVFPTFLPVLHQGARTCKYLKTIKVDSNCFLTVSTYWHSSKSGSRASWWQQMISCLMMARWIFAYHHSTKSHHRSLPVSQICYYTTLCVPISNTVFISSHLLGFKITIHTQARRHSGKGYEKRREWTGHGIDRKIETSTFLHSYYWCRLVFSSHSTFWCARNARTFQ